MAGNGNQRQPQRAQTPVPTAGGRGQPSHNPNQPRQRILRIGVLLGGNLVEERLIRDRVPVVIGQLPKKTNTFSIPVEQLPGEFTMFAMNEGRYSLRFLPKMDGRLSDAGGKVDTLDSLKQHGAQNHGDYWEAPLTDTSRGKLSLGDLTILFQFVTEPPRQPKPMLPASVRGSFSDRFDPRLVVILAVCLLFNSVASIYFLLQDPEEPDSLAQKAYNLSFNQPQDAEVEPEKPKPAEPTDQGSAAVAKTDTPKVAEKPAPTTPSKAPATDTKPAANPDGGRKENDNVTLKQEEEARAAADALTAMGPNGTTAGDMSSRRPGGDLNQQIADVKDSGKGVTVGGGHGTGSRNNGDRQIGTGTGVHTAGPGGVEVAGGPKVDAGPQGRISVSSKPAALDDSNLSPDAVLSKIQSQYMAGLKHCYKEYLKKDATSRGKVVLDLTVNESGRTVDGRASAFPADEVNGCITNLMGSWRFPIPKKDNEATSASFRIALQLVPE